MIALGVGLCAASDAASPLSPRPSANHWQGRPVQTTPFDLKLMGSGFYEIEAAAPSPQRRTLQQIFDEAATFQYRKDSGDDRWEKPAVTQTLKAGDCEDMAIWLYEELKKNGYAGVRIMVGKFEAKDASHHTWAVCTAPDGSDFIIDPALQRRIWKRSDLLPELYLPSYSFDGKFKYAHS